MCIRDSIVGQAGVEDGVQLHLAQRLDVAVAQLCREAGGIAGDGSLSGQIQPAGGHRAGAVSYTHLDLAASCQERIAGILAEKLLLAAADTGAKQVCLAGGVAANGRLRQLVNDGAQKLGAKVYLPELKFCGDNGAMIAAQGYYQYIAGHTAGLELNGLPTLPIDYE